LAKGRKQSCRAGELGTFSNRANYLYARVKKGNNYGFRKRRTAMAARYTNPNYYLACSFHASLKESCRRRSLFSMQIIFGFSMQIIFGLGVTPRGLRLSLDGQVVPIASALAC